MNQLYLFIFSLLMNINEVKSEVTDTNIMEKEFTNFLLNYNLKNNHFNKNPNLNLIEKSYLQEIDLYKNLLTEIQLNEMELQTLLLSTQKNLFKISQISKKNIDKNIDSITDQINQANINFNELNTPFNITFDKKFSSFPKNEIELLTEWKNRFKYQVIKNYIKELIENETSSLQLSEKDKDNYVLKKFIQDELILQKSIDKTKKTLISELNRIKNKTNDDYIYNVFNGLSTIYDPHSRYIPPKDEESFNSDLNGNMEGIGVELSESNGFIEVVKVIPGGSAWDSNQIESGDIFIKVKELSTNKITNLEGSSIETAVENIKGIKDSKITLYVKKKNNTITEVTIPRVSIELATTYVKYSIIEKNKEKFGYILVPKFYRNFNDANGRNCSDDVKKALIELKKSNIKGIILDLRNNGGGALIDSQIMTGLFIKQGPIVSIKSSNGYIDTYEDSDPSITYDGSLVVLVNKYSASASEIVASALQDYKRAIILGSNQTHGKGTVQSLIPFSASQFPLFSYFKNISKNLGTVKITTQKFYRITGETTQYTGVIPDVILPEPYNLDYSLEKEYEFSLKPDKIDSLKFKTYLKSNKISKISKKSQKRINSHQLVMTVKKIREQNDLNDVKQYSNLTLIDYNNIKSNNTTKIKDLYKTVYSFKDNYKITTDLNLFYPNLNNNFTDPRIKEISKTEIGKYEDTLASDYTISESINILKDLNSF